MKKLLISLIAAILICAISIPIIITVLWDLEICIATPVDSKGQYIEQFTIVGGMHATDRANQNSLDFMQKCHDFNMKFHEEHKDDKYEIHVSVDFEDGKTIVTYAGEITDSQTGKTSPYEEKLVFDYIFTRKVN
ncbi:MAG: hypothetical protein IIX14_00145 [Clostridia bacterium]|nr:hypothetical protein [Clostridia bacterium]